MKKKIVVIALSLLILVFSQLFDVRISPSKKISQLAQTLRLSKHIRQEKTGIAHTYDQLSAAVAPQSGKTVLVEWADMGQKLVAAGAIDLTKFEKRYNGLNQEQKQILQADDLRQIRFNKDNIQFWTNVLWALGLTQKSQVLSDGPMATNASQTPIKNYASTAGWTLGAKTAMNLYNSAELIKLSDQQNALVFKVGENIFRPCCGNSAAYPDCNHGMAVLGLLELMASQGATEDEMYQAALAFNSYAFESTYISAAAYYDQQGVSWTDVDAKEVLGQGFSGAQGASFIARAVGEIPGAPKRGLSCGA